MSQPGQHIRVMALQRRLMAMFLFATAGFLVLLPAILQPITLESFLVCWFLAAVVVDKGRYAWRRANQADQGAAGEEAIAQTLMPLQQQGWQIEFGVVDRSVGDIDVFLVSPQGKAYTIDVKSHRGRVTSDGKQLYRKGKPFEKDFLAQARRQAATIAKLRQLPFVQPMVVFSNAQVNLDQPVADVWVVDRADLIRRLRSDGDGATAPRPTPPKLRPR